MKRAVCEGAPSCINFILPLFCRWGMQTGVRISFEYLKAFRLALTTTHYDFIIFCDFQNYTSNDEALQGVLGNRGTRAFISGEQGNKGQFLRKQGNKDNIGEQGT